MRALFLGINRAVQFFQNLTSPIKAYCQAKGVVLQSYIDDFRTLGKDRASCERGRIFAKSVLHKVGFILKEDKTSDCSVMSLKFLGIINNLKELIYQMPSEKKSKYKENLENIVARKACTLLELAEVNGRLIHMSLAAGPVMLLLTRGLHALIADRVAAHGWHRNPVLSLATEILEDLQRILERWESLDNFPIQVENNYNHTIIAYHDASESGFCIQVVYKGQVRHEERWDKQVRLPSSEEEKQESSSYREALAITNFLSLYGTRLKNERIQTYSDSQVLESALVKGSKSKRLHKLIVDIFDLLSEHKI